MIKKARLILEDGTIFEGKPFGSQKSGAGEVVFATGMVGYDLSLTDPSYAGQILTFTYPLIGNWGIPPKEFWESEKIQVAGLVISDLTTVPSHWQSEKKLDAWLKEENIPAIYDIDTRKLTQKLRERGVMLGKIIVDDKDVEIYDPNLTNLVAEVSPTDVKIHSPNSHPGGPLSGPIGSRSGFLGPQSKGRGPQNLQSRFYRSLRSLQNDKSEIRIALLNCGAKRNILRNLLARGATVYELPWDYDPFSKSNTPEVGSPRRFTLKGFDSSGVEKMRIPKLDGLVISNGPGDPKMAKASIAIIKKALTKQIPTFGICLGNQLLALAAGGDTYKLKFGHRAQNQPTIDVTSKRCYITTQNHGFAVDEKKMPAGFKRWFYNANDNTNEGIIHEKLPFFSVQFHPEANPGPKDTEWLFDYFMNEVKKRTV